MTAGSNRGMPAQLGWSPPPRLKRSPPPRLKKKSPFTTKKEHGMLWKMVGAWFSNEQFWMGVGASTLSTVIMAVAGLVAAVITGLVDWQGFAVVLLSFAGVISLAYAIIVMLPPVRRMQRALREKVASPGAALVVTAVSALLSFLINM